MKFVWSWPALWLWMNTLNECLTGSRIDLVYTFRKAQLNIHFGGIDRPFKLAWEKQGNQAILTLSNQVSLPKRRVNVLRKILGTSRILKVQVHARDRLLKLTLQGDATLIIGFFPTALNIYLYQGDTFVESFLKQKKLPVFADEWLQPGDQLPETIPGQSITSQQLQEAQKGMAFDPENGTLTFGTSQAESQIEIPELVIEVLKRRQKPKQATSVSVSKTGRTVLQRWQVKLKKIQQELNEAKAWPKLEVRLQALQIGQGMGQGHSGTIELTAELSPTGKPLVIKLATGVSLQQTIESTAKKIRKFKGKVNLLEEIIIQVQTDITALEQLIIENDKIALQSFLQQHGEALDRSGRRQTERKPYKKYQSPGGYDILVGRGSSDNDDLTFKVAGKNDWWFHARQIRGSHVILRTGNQSPQQTDIIAAAEYAARNSKAKHSGIVVVQYCQRKHLSKPKGSSPGTVLVHHEKSITVDLDQVK